MNENSSDIQRAKLQTLIGNWEGKNFTWFEPGNPPIEEKINGTFSYEINENFVVYEYESTLEGKPFYGIAQYGYASDMKKFQCVWIDGFHMSTAMMFSEGSPTEKGFSVLGSYYYDGTKWGWRTNVEIINADEIIITAYNISPEGQEDKAIETVYKRIPNNA